MSRNLLIRLSIVTIAFLSVSACMQVPLMQYTQESCSNCTVVKPQFSYAVAKPLDSNDYPVSYRVQTPEANARIRPVDRTTVIAQTNVHISEAPCLCLINQPCSCTNK